LVPTNRLAVNLLIGCHFSFPDEFRVGSRVVRDDPVTATDPEPMFLREGSVFVALLPLAVTDMGREQALWAGRRGRYLLVELINYAGADREFSEPELLSIRNGFAVCIEEADGRDFDAWCEHAASAKVDDAVRHGQDVRTTKFGWQKTRLEMCFNHATEAVQYATIDGNAVDTFC
ncbi:MAG: hypothetical protein ACOCTQ_04215, partial [Planctomycetota bacterium]